MFDVIIVGAGPAGSTAARTLSKSGFNCLLLDKAIFPREKPCGGGITYHAFKNFPHVRKFLGPPSKGGILYYGNPVIALKDNRDDIVAFYIRRIEFDNSLLEMARTKGAIVLEGEKVVSIDYPSDRVIVHTINGNIYEGKFLIGADGVNSIVRRTCRLQKYWKKQKEAVVFMNEIEVGENNILKYFSAKRITHVHLCFGNSLGYGWVFPKLKHVNIGFGQIIEGTNSRAILRRYRDFISYCQRVGISPPLPNPMPHHLTWRVPMGGPMKKYCIGRVLLAGDAAGFVTSLMGEGIPYALWSGYIAAQIISRVLRKECKISAICSQYQKSCSKYFARELLIMAKLQEFLRKNLITFFKLARFDVRLREIPEDIILKGNSFFKNLPNLFKIIMIGVLKGNLWK